MRRLFKREKKSKKLGREREKNEILGRLAEGGRGVPRRGPEEWGLEGFFFFRASVLTVVNNVSRGWSSPQTSPLPKRSAKSGVVPSTPAKSLRGDVRDPVNALQQETASILVHRLLQARKAECRKT